MARVLFFIVLAGTILSAGCGQVFVGFVSNPQVSFSSISGIVIIVHLESGNEISGPQSFTAVTFSNGGLSSTVNFCGDQRNQFPLNQSVQADFTPGSGCSTLNKVVTL